MSFVGQGDEVVVVECEATVCDDWIERCQVSSIAVGKQVECRAEILIVLTGRIFVFRAKLRSLISRAYLRFQIYRHHVCICVCHFLTHLSANSIEIFC